MENFEFFVGKFWIFFNFCRENIKFRCFCNLLKDIILKHPVPCNNQCEEDGEHELLQSEVCQTNSCLWSISFLYISSVYLAGYITSTGDHYPST